MNIMFIATFPIVPHIGGVQRVTDILTREFQRRGIGVIYVCYSYEHYMSYLHFSAPQYLIKIEGRKNSEISQELEKLCNRYKITHVINQINDAGTLTLIKNLPPAIKSVFVCHVIPFSFDGITRKRLFALPTKTKRAKLFKLIGLICPSIYEKTFARFEVPLLREGMVVADKYCFISKRFWPRVLKHIPDFPQNKLAAICNPNTYSYKIEFQPEYLRENAVVWIGRIETNMKNLKGFLDMWNIFSKIHEDWKAYVIGDGDQMNNYINYAKRLNLNNLSFEGAQKDVMPYYKKCKFACITSFSESWCMILTEAMKCGCVPVAMNTYETLQDIIKNGYNGIICKDSPKEMASSINDVIKNDEKWNSLALNAIDSSRLFDVEFIADEWIKLLNSI